MDKFFDDKSILLTGGTGSFGRKFTELTLERLNPREIVIFSRDEMKQWFMREKISDPRVKFVIGDIRDKESLKRVTKDIDYIVHAAATKIVPSSEYNAFECVKTNILGSMNVIDAAIESGVEKVIALSTDKASAPINLYGATKLAADKLFVAANVNNRNSKTALSVVRYGNVMGSRGSVIPFFQSLKSSNELPITDINMTRFMITLEEAIEIVWLAFIDAVGGEIYVKKIPSMKVVDIARAISPDPKFKVIGIRPGEKIHEQMIGLEDAPQTYEYENYYKILPTMNDFHKDTNRIKGGKKVSSEFSYTSNNNTNWMTILELKKWISSYTQLDY